MNVTDVESWLFHLHNTLTPIASQLRVALAGGARVCFGAFICRDSGVAVQVNHELVINSLVQRSLNLFKHATLDDSYKFHLIVLRLGWLDGQTARAASQAVFATGSLIKMGPFTYPFSNADIVVHEIAVFYNLVR